jgi:hypothetical protein
VTLLASVAVFVVGYLAGTVTRVLAWIAAVAALLLAVLGTVTAGSLAAATEPVLAFYRGNELLFLSGFLFAIAHRGAPEE